MQGEMLSQNQKIHEYTKPEGDRDAAHRRRARMNQPRCKLYVVHETIW